MVPIVLNNVLYLYQQINSDLKHKGNLVSLQVQTAHFLIGVNTKQVGTSFKKKTAQNIDLIKKNPLSVIVTILKIYQEVFPSMIDVEQIIPLDVFKTLCKGTEVAEFNNILFKARGKHFELIQADFNDKICLTDETSEKVKAWKEENDNQELDSQGSPITAYFYSFSPIGIRYQPERDTVNKLVHWNVSGIQILYALYWLNLHKHGWEYAELLCVNIMEEVKQLVFP